MSPNPFSIRDSKIHMNPLKGMPSLFLLFMLASCVPQAMQEKHAKLCNDLATLNDAIAPLKQLQDNTTVAKLKQAELRVREAFQNFKAFAQQVQTAEVDQDVENLEKAYEDLDKSVQAIPNQAPIAQALASILDKVTAMESALDQAKSGLRCPSSQF